MRLPIWTLPWLMLAACTHEGRQAQLDAELAAEPALASSEEVRANAKTLIESSSLLTKDQKMRLLGLQEVTGSRTNALSQESLKLRSLLIKELAKYSYDDDKVQTIKNRLKTVENLQLSILFKAIDEANLILGHDSRENERILRAFDFGGARPELH